MHKTSLIGNLGSDPEQREAGWNNATNFTVAVNERWKDPEGEKQTRTIWYRVTAWGKLGEICFEHLQKGRKVYVEGKLVPDNGTGGPRIWTREDGTSAAAFELRAPSFGFASSSSASFWWLSLTGTPWTDRSKRTGVNAPPDSRRRSPAI